MKPTLEDRMKTVSKEGEALQAKHKEIAGVRDNCNRQLSQIETRLLQLDGQIQMLKIQIADRDAEKKGTPKEKTK